MNMKGFRAWLMRAVYILFLILPLVANGSKMGYPPWEPVDVMEYQGYTGQQMTVAWDDQPYQAVGSGWCPLATFQIQVYNRERDITVWVDDNIPRDVFSYTYSFTKTGHWESRIRVRQKCEEPYRDPASLSCNGHENDDDKENGYEYSKWCSSLNPECATVTRNGEQVSGAWRNFVWVYGVGPLF